MEIGLLGATGPAGQALAVRLASVGHEVILGSRSKYRAMEVRDKLLDCWPKRDLIIRSADNAIAQVAGEFQPLVPPRGSVSASVQAEVTDSYVAAALHHVPATELGDLDHEVVSDVLICSDHEKATETVSSIIADIPGARPLDAGGLSNATAIEAFTAVLLQLNDRYGTRVAVRLTGIED